MTNKEKIKKSINMDFDKEYNYNAIINKIEGEKMKNRKKLWRWSLVPICLAIVMSGLLFINLQDNTKLSSPEIPLINEENKIKLNINNLDKIGAFLFDAKIKDMPTNGINIPWPNILKDGITIPKDLAKYKANAYYTRKDRTGEYNILNCYVYNYFNENDDYYRNIRIAFSDKYKPIRDYHFSDENSKETIINDTKLTVFKYNTIYFTEFNYEGYNFDIETNNISEQELLDLILSIIK